MKKYFEVIMFFLMIQSCFALNVERLGTVGLCYHEGRVVGDCPSGIYIDEVSEQFYLHEGLQERMHVYDMNNNLEEIKTLEVAHNVWADDYIFLKNYVFAYGYFVLDILDGNNEIINVSEKEYNRNENGICFILKKGNGYIVYYVDENGWAHAVDTEGRLYSSYQAMEYLKNTYPEQYEKDMELSKKYSLFNDFCSGKVLIWKGTYYSEMETLNNFWKNTMSPFPSGSKPIYWDEDGNGSQWFVSEYYQKGYLRINSGDGKTLVDKVDIADYSKVLKRAFESKISKTDYYYTSAMYSGFGGDIYFYFAGEGEDTELFRVRRTWGNPNLYSIVVNGWTDDEYGRYVDGVLKTMDKKELRLLRNTVYALYGYHFNSKDLQDYFGEKVWYEDKGLGADAMELNPSRQALINKIMFLEDK